MDKLLLLLIIVNGLLLGRCIPKKTKNAIPSTISTKQIELERTHYRDYALNPEPYLKWPELDRVKTKEICECYLQKIFPFRDVTTGEHIVKRVEIFYRGIKDVNQKEVSREVAALQCKLSRRDSRRILFFFSRALTSRCMRLLNSYVRASTTKFHMVVEICDNHKYKDLKKNGDLTRDVLYTVNMVTENDLVEKQKKWEQTHFKYFLLMPELYIKWPELNNEHALWKYCHIFVMELHPRKQLEVLNASYDSMILRYIRIKTVVDPEYNPVLVAALRCQTPVTSIRFLRAPNPECVFMVKKSPRWVKVLPASFSIVKYLCDKQVVQNAREQVPQPQHNENEVVNQPSNENGEWLWDFPIDDGSLELVSRNPNSDLPKQL